MILDIDIDDVGIDEPAGSQRGQFSTPGTAPTAFSGWLQLAQAIGTTLEAARHAGPPAGSGQPSTDTDQAGCGPEGQPTDKGAQR